MTFTDFDAVLFDMDGTLVDSERFTERAIEGVLREENGKRTPRPGTKLRRTAGSGQITNNWRKRLCSCGMRWQASSRLTKVLAMG